MNTAEEQAAALARLAAAVERIAAALENKTRTINLDPPRETK